MRRTEVFRYLEDLGWRDPPELEIQLGAGSAAAGNLAAIKTAIEGCQDCDLSRRRKHIVLGGGDPYARVMFIGEAPGADEDRQGKPFVGQAGRLLDGMIRALGLKRNAVYITNVLKCRPPGNRDPKPEEIAACAAYLQRQIDTIEPEVIIALGRFAARWLTGSDATMGALRGKWGSYRGIALMSVYHPAYLLRNPSGKARVWEDLKKVIVRLRETPGARAKE